MDKAETRIMEMFTRVRIFMVARSAQFPGTTRAGELLTELNLALAELQSLAAAQASSARDSKEGTDIKSAAMAELQDDLEAICRTVRVMSPTTPGLEEKFRLPKNAGTQAWLAAARAIAEDAQPLKAEIVRRGLSENFLEDLEADVAQIERIIDQQARVTAASVAATAAIDKTIDEGMKIVRELDVIIRNIFSNDSVTLAEWTSARHIERPPRRAPAQPTPTQ